MITFKLKNLTLNNLTAEERFALEDLTRISDSIEVNQISTYKNITTEYEVTVKKEKISITFYMHINKDNSIKFITTQRNKYNNISKYPKLELIDIVDQFYLKQNHKLKHTLDIVTCKNQQCPICGSKMKNYKLILNSSYCENKCYFMQLHKNNSLQLTIITFEEKISNYHYVTNLNKRIKIVNQIYDKINELKKDDNYLMKIIAQNN